VFEWFLLAGFSVLHYRRNISLRSSGTSAAPGGFSASSDKSGIISNEVLPGKSIINPNYID